MESKYNYYSRYKIEGLENHIFKEIILPIENHIIREMYIYRDDQKVFADFQIKECICDYKSIEDECVLLIRKLFYRLFVREVYVPKISYLHMNSSYPLQGKVVCSSITITSDIDFYGKMEVLNCELFKGFEFVKPSNPCFMYLESLLGIKEKAYRFVALYQFLIDGQTISQLMEWLENMNIMKEYDIKIRNNPNKDYISENPKLDELSYLRTIIAHFQTDKWEYFRTEYENMIDENMRKIISIIRIYKC